MNNAISTLKTIIKKNEWDQDADIIRNDWDVVDERISAKYTMI